MTTPATTTPATMTPAKCRAGRAMIGWSQERLAVEANVGLSTVRSYEKGLSEPIQVNRQAIQGALEANSIRFTERGIELAD